MAGDWARSAQAGVSAQERPACGVVNREEDGGVSVWTAAKNPGTRQLRSWAFDAGCAAVAAAVSLAHFSFGQAGHASHLALAAGVIVAVVTALPLVLRRIWPGPVHRRMSRPGRLAPPTLARNCQPRKGGQNGRARPARTHPPAVGR
jgi:hypothetical protein